MKIVNKLRQKGDIRFVGYIVSFIIGSNLMFIAGVVVFCLVAVGGNPKDVFFFGYKPMVVISGSMEPTIQTNALCLVKKEPYSEIKAGDIIVYKSHNGYMVTHRVKYKTTIGFITKGDNNMGDDIYPVTEDMYHSKVVKVWNNTTHFFNIILGDFTTIMESDKHTLGIIVVGVRWLLGLSLIAVVLAFGIFLINNIYDFIVINYFMHKKPVETVNSLMMWTSIRIKNDDLIDLVEKSKRQKLLKRIISYYYIMRVYNKLLNEEKEAKKVKKLYDRVSRLLK